jgi:hypothetical protein
MSGLEPETQPSTTRISSGSARATAVGIALLLLAVVWFGASGRPPPPAAVAPSAQPAVTSFMARATPQASRPQTPARTQSAATATSRPPGQPEPALVPGQFGEQALAIIVHASGKPRQYLQILHEAGPGVLEAGFRMSYPRPPIDGTLELAQLWTRDEGPPFVVIESVTLPIEALQPGAGDSAVIDLTSVAQPDRLEAPRLVRLGYRLSVRVESRDGQPFLAVTVSVGQMHDRGLGDDGLIGNPGSAGDELSR